MKEKDLLDIKTFQRLWKEKDENELFCKLLSYFQINLESTELIKDDKYIILHDRNQEQYIVFFSSLHPLEDDFFKRKQKLKIKKIRLIGLE